MPVCVRACVRACVCVCLIVRARMRALTCNVYSRVCTCVHARACVCACVEVMKIRTQSVIIIIIKESVCQWGWWCRRSVRNTCFAEWERRHVG